MATSTSLQGVYQRQKELHQHLEHLPYHQRQCQRLCQRIDRLIDPLERLEHASSITLRDETREILQQFLQCLDESNEFLQRCQTIVDPNQFDSERFDDLNRRLAQIAADLSLGINIQQIFDREEDIHDRRDDLEEIAMKFDQIGENITKKQSEQYEKFEQLLNKRLEGFHQHLVQTVSSTPQNFDFLSIPYRDLSIEQFPLGRGGFADVYKAIWLTHQDQVAVKVLHLRHLNYIEKDFQREISTLYRIRYEHVINVLGACVEENFYAIVMELMPLGSLYDVLHAEETKKIHFQWSDRYSLAWQMAKAINYLHNFNPMILHRDIKSMNFLLKYHGTNQMKYLIKVCDFGLAEIRREILVQSSLNDASQCVGSLVWKAPELFGKAARHSKATDVYSLGMVFWELATEKRPWHEYEDQTMIIAQVKLGERPEIPSNVPDDYQQWIHQAWHPDPQQRPSCFQLMQQIAAATVPKEEEDEKREIKVDEPLPAEEMNQ